MRVDTLSGPCRDTARRMVAHHELDAVPLPEADAVATLAFFREPEKGKYELCLKVGGELKTYRLNLGQVKLLAFQTVNAITK